MIGTLNSAQSYTELKKYLKEFRQVQEQVRANPQVYASYFSNGTTPNPDSISHINTILARRHNKKSPQSEYENLATMVNFSNAITGNNSDNAGDLATVNDCDVSFYCFSKELGDVVEREDASGGKKLKNPENFNIDLLEKAQKEVVSKREALKAAKKQTGKARRKLGGKRFLFLLSFLPVVLAFAATAFGFYAGISWLAVQTITTSFVAIPVSLVPGLLGAWITKKIFNKVILKAAEKVGTAKGEVSGAKEAQEAAEKEFKKAEQEYANLHKYAKKILKGYNYEPGFDESLAQTALMERANGVSASAKGAEQSAPANANQNAQANARQQEMSADAQRAQNAGQVTPEVKPLSRQGEEQQRIDVPEMTKREEAHSAEPDMIEIVGRNRSESPSEEQQLPAQDNLAKGEQQDSLGLGAQTLPQPNEPSPSSETEPERQKEKTDFSVDENNPNQGYQTRANVSNDDVLEIINNFISSGKLEDDYTYEDYLKEQKANALKELEEDEGEKPKQATKSDLSKVDSLFKTKTKTSSQQNNKPNEGKNLDDTSSRKSESASKGVENWQEPVALLTAASKSIEEQKEEQNAKTEPTQNQLDLVDNIFGGRNKKTGKVQESAKTTAISKVQEPVQTSAVSKVEEPVQAAENVINPEQRIVKVEEPVQGVATENAFEPEQGIEPLRDNAPEQNAERVQESASANSLARENVENVNAQSSRNTYSSNATEQANSVSEIEAQSQNEEAIVRQAEQQRGQAEAETNNRTTAVTVYSQPQTSVEVYNPESNAVLDSVRERRIASEEAQRGASAQINTAELEQTYFSQEDDQVDPDVTEQRNENISLVERAQGVGQFEGAGESQNAEQFEEPESEQETVHGEQTNYSNQVEAKEQSDMVEAKQTIEKPKNDFAGKRKISIKDLLSSPDLRKPQKDSVTQNLEQSEAADVVEQEEPENEDAQNENVQNAKSQPLSVEPARNDMGGKINYEDIMRSPDLRKPQEDVVTERLGQQFNASQSLQADELEDAGQEIDAEENYQSSVVPVAQKQTAVEVYRPRNATKLKKQEEENARRKAEAGLSRKEVGQTREEMFEIMNHALEDGYTGNFSEIVPAEFMQLESEVDENFERSKQIKREGTITPQDQEFVARANYEKAVCDYYGRFVPRTYTDGRVIKPANYTIAYTPNENLGYEDLKKKRSILTYRQKAYKALCDLGEVSLKNQGADSEVINEGLSEFLNQIDLAKERTRQVEEEINVRNNAILAGVANSITVAMGTKSKTVRFSAKEKKIAQETAQENLREALKEYGKKKYLQKSNSAKREELESQIEYLRDSIAKIDAYGLYKQLNYKTAQELEYELVLTESNSRTLENLETLFKSRGSGNTVKAKVVHAQLDRTASLEDYVEEQANQTARDNSISTLGRLYEDAVGEEKQAIKQQIEKTQSQFVGKNNEFLSLQEKVFSDCQDQMNIVLKFQTQKLAGESAEIRRSDLTTQEVEARKEKLEQARKLYASLKQSVSFSDDDYISSGLNKMDALENVKDKAQSIDQLIKTANSKKELTKLAHHDQTEEYKQQLLARFSNMTRKQKSATVEASNTGGGQDLAQSAVQSKTNAQVAPSQNNNLHGKGNSEIESEEEMER